MTDRPASTPRPPDTAYVDATVVTGDPARPTVSALWVRDGRIAAVGERDQVLGAAGPEVRVVSLRGRTVLPGLIDAHCHLTWFGYLATGADCSPRAAPDIAALQSALAASEPRADGWVTGSGYAEYELVEGRPPTRDELDEAVPHTPCVLYQTSMHVGVVNSAGLRELGLTDASPDPPQGKLGRDRAGRLDGRIYETPLFDLLEANLQRHLDNAGPVGQAALFEEAGRRLAALGITSCADASTNPRSFSAMRRAERSGRLPIRVTAMFTYPEADWLFEAGMTTGFGSDALRIGGIKVWADGGMSSRTAAVDEPYLDPPGEMGILWHDVDALVAMIRRCEAAGFQLAVHAQGERAIASVLDAVEAAAEPGNPLRHRIEHGGAFRPERWEEAARLGIHVVSQPGFISQLGDGFIKAFGEDRSRYLYPFAGLQDAGVIVAGSSDIPVIDPSPFLGMRDAVLRRTRTGLSLAPEQALTPAAALDLYTSRAAFVGWAEGRLGSLQQGKLADFTVVDRNPLEVDASSLAETNVLLTVVGGVPVFQAEAPVGT